MRSDFSQAVQAFFRPETFAPFVIGSIFLSVLGSAITQILFKLIGDSAGDALKIAIAASIIFAIAVSVFAKNLQRPQPQIFPFAQSPQLHRGLLLLVSNEEPCKTAIAYHQSTLQQCWLICSLESQPKADRLIEQLHTQGIQTVKVMINDHDVHDPIPYFQAVSAICTHLPSDWSANDLILDYTGMTASASVGVVWASLRHKTALQYTPADPANSKRSLQPIEIRLTRERT
jgi:threonine/homoserine efflux transporter RhtA